MIKNKLYTCMCCGFMVFEEVFSEYEICPICTFQDSFGAIELPNESYYLDGESLIKQQQNILQKIPENIKNIIYFRNSLWIAFGKNNSIYFPKWKYIEYVDKYGKN